MIWRIYLLFQESFIAGDTRYHFGVSPIHADFPRKEERQYGGRNHNWERTYHARGRFTHPAFRCNRMRSFLHGWKQEYFFPRRYRGDPILTTQAGKPRRMPGIFRKYQLWQHTTCPSHQPLLGKRATHRTNDDHFMHIPGISSHRNVSNCSS